MAKTITIVDGMLTVPRGSGSYAFVRSPERMEWLASHGYTFGSLHDDHKTYAAIVLCREELSAGDEYRCLTNCRNSENMHEITHLIDEQIDLARNEPYQYW